MQELSFYSGGLAQLGERLPYKQNVGGSIPSTSIYLITQTGQVNVYNCLSH